MIASQRFSGRVIAVIGASSGIGAEVARQVAREGARVVLVARRVDALNAVMEEMSGSDHLVVPCDCADEVAFEEVRERLSALSLRLDGLVLAAGAHNMRPLQLTRWAHMDAMLRANLATTVIPLRALATLLQRDRAAVVGVSSMAAVRGGAGVLAYSAAKGAVESALRVAATELASRGIRVNWIRPGVVETPMSEGFLGKLPPNAVASIRQAHPLGLGTPATVAPVVLFLLSDEAKWITGSAYDVHGGFGIS